MHFHVRILFMNVYVTILHEHVKAQKMNDIFYSKN